MTLALAGLGGEVAHDVLIRVTQQVGCTTMRGLTFDQTCPGVPGSKRGTM